MPKPKHKNGNPILELDIDPTVRDGLASVVDSTLLSGDHLSYPEIVSLETDLQNMVEAKEFRKKGLNETAKEYEQRGGTAKTIVQDLTYDLMQHPMQFEQEFTTITQAKLAPGVMHKLLADIALGTQEIEDATRPDGTTNKAMLAEATTFEENAATAVRKALTESIQEGVLGGPLSTPQSPKDSPVTKKR